MVLLILGIRGSLLIMFLHLSPLIFLFFFGMVNYKPRAFLLAGLIYLTIGSLFIIFDYVRGYTIFSELKALIFSLTYICVHLLEVMFPKISGEVLEQTSPYPLISLSLYATLIVITYIFQKYPLWLSAGIPICDYSPICYIFIKLS